MKKTDLLEALGDVSEKYLNEAQERAAKMEDISEAEHIVMGVEVMKERKTGRILSRFAAAAAAVVILAGGAVLYTGRGNFGTGNAEPVIELTNHMTEKERSSICAGELTLIGEETTEHTVELELWDEKDYLAWLEENRDDFTKEEYEQYYELYTNHVFVDIHGVLIDGRNYTGFMPVYGYQGGQIHYAYTTTTSTNGVPEEPVTNEVSFEHFDDFKEWYRGHLDELVSSGEMLRSEADREYEDMLIIFDAVMNEEYTILDRPIEEYLTKMDYRTKWEFDADAVREIADDVIEYTVYDEELDDDFIVHVTLPPDYDESKRYPAFVLTDGVWRFGNHPELRNVMEEQEAEDVILVSIGYDFSVDGTDNAVRAEYFCEESDLFLDFITDNLMPYLGECYRIDFARSALYGHSLGGVFTHYAAFNSDRYENQPFGSYIIGSPAFWSPYFLPTENAAQYRSEYGYFERNESFEKRLYLCGGGEEDADYEEYYGENESTLEGLASLLVRLEGYGVRSIESRVYEDANHYDYIPEMLCEFLRTYFS